MSRAIRGLYKRFTASGDCTWYIDKYIKRVGRLCESTGTADRDEAERYLLHRIRELRDIAIYGVRPRRKFHEAAAKYLNDFALKSTIRRDAAALKDLEPYIGDLWLDQINNDSFIVYRNARQDLSIVTRNGKIGVARRILKLAAEVWCYPKTNIIWLERAPTILAEKGHRPRDPYPLDASEQELLSRKTPSRTSGAFEEYRGRVWWVLTGSNRRHSPCKGDALPAELSTHDPGRCEILTGAEAKFGCDRACLGQRGRECRSVRRRYNLLQPPAVTPRALVVHRGRGGNHRRSHRRVRLLMRPRLFSQRVRQYLVDPFHRLDLEISLDVVRDFHQILHVLVRDEHGLDAATMRGQQLLLQAPDRQHFPAQRDLPGHRHI